MHVIAAVTGCGLLAIVLADAFETIIVARRASQIFLITRLFYQLTWAPVAAVGRHIHSGQLRERFLGLYGPLSLLMLLGSWATGLIVGFSLLQWTAGLHMNSDQPRFPHDFYFSATTFFTLAFNEPSNAASNLPPWIPTATHRDNWQSTAWIDRSAFLPCRTPSQSNRIAALKRYRQFWH